MRPYNATKQETLEVVQSRARQEIVLQESGLFILQIVVGIAPLLGLLGAVAGLVQSLWQHWLRCHVNVRS